ncbi:Coenzyme F420 hydrogenase/dehydrogenase, beta subunit C-terminal domain [Thermovibrio sp.]
MLTLNKEFLLGKFKKVFFVKANVGSPLELFFKIMLKEGLIDGLLAYREREGEVYPELMLSESEVKISLLNRNNGLNGLLKKAVQKYRLNKLAVFGPACVFDGLNKTQYFGIGCNWTKTAVALKVGLLCTGALTKEAQKAQVIHLRGKEGKVERLFYEKGTLCYITTDREVLKVPPQVHHTYTLTTCKYCINFSAIGTDITFVPLKEKETGLLIVRSERGWYTLAQVQKVKPGELKVWGAKEKEVEELLPGLKEKILLNINDILERVELGIPVPKWSDNKLRKFYRAWNSIEGTSLEEVF